MNTREVGGLHEQQACDYLENEGLKIIMKNYRKKIGEIDIIAQDGEYLVFVEVKYRSYLNQGGASYAIGPAKQMKIRRVAQWFMTENHINREALCRFDAVLIDGENIRHIKNAWR